MRGTVDSHVAVGVGVGVGVTSDEREVPPVTDNPTEVVRDVEWFDHVPVERDSELAADIRLFVERLPIVGSPVPTERRSRSTTTSPTQSG
ncbi:hypothetical protein [Halosolutus halophilus]|uniref:hypothetical protein n=1 Tax=Halosolutus halophilus TaxID=1552990 RepID=UPI0022352069|nr:hypothetical protein [Halosolutus halophilus]